MTPLAPACLAAIFVVAAIAVRNTADPRAARRRAVAASLVSIAVAFGALFWRPAWEVAWLPTGLLKVAPLVTSMVALIAVGLGPLRKQPPPTISRIMLLCAIGEAFLATSEPLVLGALWAASAWLTWLELRGWCEGERWHRLFAWYHGLSALLFMTGALLLTRGTSPALAAALLLAAVGIREGVIPVHSWFPRLVERAPMGIVVAFAGPQLGIYAQLELLGQGGVGDLAHAVAVVGVVTAVGAAMLGVVQKNARRAIAYLILSQTGLVAFGLESRSEVGLTGALLNWQVLALATSGFAMVLAALEARRGSVSISVPSGNFSETPKLGIAFLVLGFASVGFPMTGGFIAEDLLVQGTIDEFPILGFALVVATAFNGITVLRSFFYLFTGSRHPSGEQDLSRREHWIVGAVMTTLIVCGVAPWHIVSFEKAAAPDKTAAPHERAAAR